MTQGKHRETIMATLRAACRTPLRNEDLAWRDIEALMTRAANPDSTEGGRTAILEKWVYGLSLIYAHQTGAMPGFTNSESETRFERFAFTIPFPPELKVTRNLIKACIRRLDAKHNLQFAADLKQMSGEDAAE